MIGKVDAVPRVVEELRPPVCEPRVQVVGELLHLRIVLETFAARAVRLVRLHRGTLAASGAIPHEP